MYGANRVRADGETTQQNIAGVEHATAELSTAVNFAEKYSDECLKVPNSVCVGGDSLVITGNKVPDGLMCWLTFDQLYPIDHSGNGNHMHRAPRAGPGFNGHGASAAFVKGASSNIKSSPNLESGDFTMSFWMYLLSDSNGFFRNVVSKGNDESRTPSLMFYPDSRRISLRVNTHSGSEGLPSVGILPLRRWTHIAVTASQGRLKLFLNGMKDNEVVLRGSVLPNQADFVLGASVENPGFEGYIDDFRFYNKGLPDAEITASTTPSLTGVSDTEFVTLGCDSCGYEFATQSNMCGEPSGHLCSLQELYQGGIHSARINGLLNSKTELWHGNMVTGEAGPEERRMALCCASRDVGL